MEEPDMKSHLCLATFAAIVIAVLPASASQEKVATSNLTKVSATITAIDPATRMVTFRGESGNEETVRAPADMKRFDELKVGDRLNLSYYTSRVIKLRKAGAP